MKQQVKERELATPETGLPVTHGHTVRTEFAHCKTWMVKYQPRRNVVDNGCILSKKFKQILIVTDEHGLLFSILLEGRQYTVS